MDSPQKLSLDKSWTITIGEHFLTPSWSPITILDIAHVLGQIKQLCGQICDPLKKWVLVQVEPSKMEQVKFHTVSFLWVLCFPA